MATPSETSKADLTDTDRAEIINDIRTVKDHIRNVRENIQQELQELGKSEKRLEYLLKELSGEIPASIHLEDSDTLPMIIEGVRVSEASLRRALKRHGLDPNLIKRARFYVSVAETHKSGKPRLRISFNAHRAIVMISRWHRLCNSTGTASDQIPYSRIEEALTGVSRLGQVKELLALDKPEQSSRLDISLLFDRLSWAGTPRSPNTDVWVPYDS